MSFLLTLLLFYLDESRYSLGFVTKLREIVMVILFSLLFSGAPIAIYNFMNNQNEKGKLGISMTGFLPALASLYWLIF